MDRLIKLTEYEISLQKPVTFLYTNNEQIEKEGRQNNSTYKSLKNKIPRNKLNKGCKRSLKENYKQLKKEIAEDYRKWKNLP
jgi:DNA-binding transcriptional regulator GbsR (MarR family)